MVGDDLPWYQYIFNRDYESLWFKGAQPTLVRPRPVRANGKMRACSLGLVGLGLGIRLGLLLGIGLVLGLAMVLRLAHLTFSHTSSQQNPASLQARILPITSGKSSSQRWSKTLEIRKNFNKVITEFVYVNTVAIRRMLKCFSDY